MPVLIDLREKQTASSLGEQGLLTSDIFFTHPSNFRKIQTAIKTHSASWEAQTWPLSSSTKTWNARMSEPWNTKTRNALKIKPK